MAGEMSTYELDDEMVLMWLTESGALHALSKSRAAAGLAAALEGQVGLAVPTLPCAVVRTEDGLFVHVDPGSDNPWRRSQEESQDRRPTASGTAWRTRNNLGRVVEVLYPGVADGPIVELHPYETVLDESERMD